jgi:hypothetical protein
VIARVCVRKLSQNESDVVDVGVEVGIEVGIEVEIEVEIEVGGYSSMVH